MTDQQDQLAPQLPRVAITFCTQCRWMLRAAYYGQEILSTFGTKIGEVALLPSTGGIFQIHLVYQSSESSAANTTTLWDRKTDGGFPETKVLKQRLRDFIEPERNLGHSDTPSRKATSDAGKKEGKSEVSETPKKAENCEDCT